MNVHDIAPVLLLSLCISELKTVRTIILSIYIELLTSAKLSREVSFWKLPFRISAYTNGYYQSSIYCPLIMEQM